MKGFITNLILLLIAFIIGITLSELILRAFINIKYQFKEELGGMRVFPYPGLSYDMEKCSECTIKINSLGLRGDEITKEKSKNTIRILIIGDSATFGAGVIKEEETVPGRLRQLFTNNPPLKDYNFEIINGGIPGYDIQEIYLHYKFKLSHLKSDIVVYNFFPNDFLNARFTVEKINGKPTLIRYVDASMPGLQIIRFLPDNLNLLLNQYSLLYRYSLFYISQLGDNITLNNLNFMNKYQLANLKYLNLLSDEIKKNGSKYMISSEIYSFCANCKEPLDNQNCPENKGCFAAFWTIKYVEEYCNNNGIPYVNLSSVVSDMPLAELMIDDFAHYTGKANVIMGDKLYEFLVNTYFPSVQK